MAEEESIKPERLWAFQKKLMSLVKKEFGTHGSEGDPKVEVSLVDRTRYQQSNFSPVPYAYKISSNRDEDSYLRAISCNLGLAMGEVDNYLRKHSDFLYRQIKQDEREAAAKKSKLRLCWLPSCDICDSLTYKDAVLDLMGRVHYGRGDEFLPKVEPKEMDRSRGIYRFMLPGGYHVTWIHEPIQRDGEERRLPCGEISLNGKVLSAYRYNKDVDEGLRITLQRPDYVPPYLIPLLQAEISRPLLNPKAK
jgi:hypothetical protein